MMKAEEALALKVNCDLSDSQYQVLRNSSLKQNAEIYPSVKVIFDAKSKFYPENLEILETSAKCYVQSMVNHTLSRIMNISNAECLDLQLTETTNSNY